MKVLIPTSGLGTRLGNLTKYTNKSLAKIGDKPAISRIIDCYPNAEFVITLGHFGSYVKQFLELCYPDRKFEFVWVDPYDGDKASLVKSMSFAKDMLQCPFIIHVCDTILEDQIAIVDHNWLGCAISDKSDIFRTIKSNNGYVAAINEKGEIHYDYALIGVQGVYDYKLFWEELVALLDSGINDMSDCHVFRNMLGKTTIKTKVFSRWYDTGSVENLANASRHYKQQYNVLDKNDEAIYFIDDNVIKFFSNPDICKNRVARNLSLGSLVPQITASTDNFYMYKLVDGELLSHVVTSSSVIDLVQWAEECLWLSNSSISQLDVDEFERSCYVFYHNKTTNRVSEYLRMNGEADKENEINGVVVPPCSHMLELINWDEICRGEPTKFHGDFILDNILQTNDSFTLLDWRQEFAGHINYGDKYYDLAKLNHNLVFNHDIVSNNGYRLRVDGDKISCDILKSHNLSLYQKDLMEYLDRSYNIKKIRIITCLIWLNMAPLHVYPLNRFLYYFGKYNLWRELCAKN